MITVDGAGFSHKLLEHLDKLAARRGHALVYSAGWSWMTGRRPRYGWSRSRHGRSPWITAGKSASGALTAPAGTAGARSRKPMPPS